MKHVSVGLSVAIFCLFTSACATASVAPTPTPTTTLTITPTAILVKNTLTASPTIKVSPTPTGLVWAQAAGNPIELDQFTFGLWSPTANEIVGTQRSISSRDLSDYGKGATIVLYNAPAFSAKVLGAALKDDDIYGSVIWSPDGQKIFYGVIESIGAFTSTGTIWSISPDGSKLKSHSKASGLGFLGWMDTHALVYSGYTGGGTTQVAALDVLKNEIVTGDSLTGAPESFNANYISVTTCWPVCHICVLPRIPTQEPPKLSNCGVEPGFGDTRPFPHDEVYPDDHPREIETIFQDWQADSNNLLVLAQREISNTFASRLLLWNADTDQVTSLAPGGLFGRFSPNGKLLAYITSGPSDQYPEKNSQNIPLDTVSFDDKDYLQIMDVDTKQIILRVPIKADRREDYSSSSSFDFTKPDELSFSPNGSYLAFVTGGAITLKDAHLPTEVTLTDTAKGYLNILDLQAGELVESLLLDEYGEHTYAQVLWAPTNEKFLYQDNHTNWQVFELSNKAIFPITQHNGNQLIDPAWSYDGSYLSFGSRYEAINDPMKTYILTLTINQP